MGYTVNITGAGEPEQASSLLVTDGLLPVLGATPLMGRSFTQADDQQGSPDTVMLTYGYWQRKFSSDRSVVGKVPQAPTETGLILRQGEGGCKNRVPSHHDDWQNFSSPADVLTVEALLAPFRFGARGRANQMRFSL